MQLPHGKKLWALIGTFAGAVVTIAAASWVIFLSNGSGNGRIPNLPAENTELVFHGMNDGDWQRMKPLLPGLTIPSPAPRDGAVVILKDGRKEWITLNAQTMALEGSDAARALVGSSKTSIRNELVVRSAPVETPWVVASRSVLPLTGQFSRIDLLEAPSFSWVSADVENRTETALAAQGLNDLLYVRDVMPVWEKLMTFVDAERKPLVQSLLRTAISSRFGDDISAEHEILPLFAHSLTIWKGTENGLLLYGSSDELSDDMIDQLHAHASAGFTGTKRLQAETDEGFVIDVLEKDTTLSSHKDRMEGGWEIAETTSGDTPVLLTAVRGKNLIVTNNRTFLETALTASEHATDALAKGTLSADSIATVRPLLPAALVDKLLQFAETGQPLSFELTEQNGIWTLSF